MKKTFVLFLLLGLALSSCRTYYVGGNPASMLKNKQQADGLALTSCPDTALNGLLYYLDFKNDYQLDKILKADVRGLGDFKTYVGTKILSTGKVLANLKKLKTGCTAFVCQSPSGDVLYARNFDFTADGPSPVVVTQTQPANGHRSVSLVSLSLLNYPQGSLSDKSTDVSLLAAAPYLLMDGMNEKGLAVSVLYLDLKDTATGRYIGCTQQYDRSKHDMMTTSMMRMILDRAATVDEALTMIGQYNMFANGKKSEGSYHFLLADTTGKTIILEYVPLAGSWTMVPIQSAGNLATNFYLHPDYYGIGHGHDRYDKALRTLTEAHNVLSEEQAMQLLSEVSQQSTAAKTSNTQWSVVYNLTQKSYFLSIGRDYQHPVKGKLSLHTSSK